jgi:hypothetical protein
MLLTWNFTVPSLISRMELISLLERRRWISSRMRLSRRVSATPLRATLDQLQDAPLATGQRYASACAGARHLVGVAHVLFQDFLSDPEVSFGHGVDGGGEVRLHIAVGQEALNAEKEQAAEFLAGQGLVEDDGTRVREADPEGAEVPAERHRQGGAVKNKDGRGSAAAVAVVEDVVVGDQLQVAVCGEQAVELGSGQGVVFHHANSGARLRAALGGHLICIGRRWVAARPRGGAEM